MLLALVLMCFAQPAAAAGQGAAPRLGVGGSVGPLLNDAGSSQSLSFSFAPGERLDLVVSAERHHVPTEVNRYDHGYSVSRGGTTLSITGEARFAPFSFGRFSPYVLAGGGGGTARPNVNEFFPTRVSQDIALLFAGAGVRVPLARRLSAFADVRFALQVGRSEAGVYGFAPLRAGLAWRF